MRSRRLRFISFAGTTDLSAYTESFNRSKSHFQLRPCSVVPAINVLIATTIDKPKKLTGAGGKSFSTIPIENDTQRA